MQIILSQLRKQKYSSTKILLGYLCVYIVLTPLMLGLGSLSAAAHSVWIAQVSSTRRDNTNQFKVVNGYTQRGWEFFRKSQFQKAIHEFSQAIALDPDYPQIYLDRGIVYRAAGNYAASLKDISMQIELDPFGAAYHERGLTYLAMGESQKALEDFNQAIEQSSPEFEFVADAYYQRGLIRKTLGDRQEAIQDFRAAIKVYRKLGMIGEPGYKKTIQELHSLL